MRNPLFLKTLAIGFVLLLIWVPLTMIGTIVHERQQRQQEAAREIGASYATQQRLLGPVLVIPYRETYFSEEAVTDAKGNRTQKQIEQRVRVIAPAHAMGGRKGCVERWASAKTAAMGV